MITLPLPRSRAPFGNNHALTCLRCSPQPPCRLHRQEVRRWRAGLAPAQAESDESTASEAGTGTGHLHVTGDVTIDHDFIVDACQIAPPGDGLLAGYHMNAKDGDSTLVMLSIVVKGYDKDGPYSPASSIDGGAGGER